MKKVSDIIKEMENFAPTFLKESYDNVGLMVGSKEQEVKKVLIALDATLEVIEEAIAANVDLIITHHPLIFRKPSNITMDSVQGQKIIKLIKNDISLYSSHTNLDSVYNGINETIAKLIGLNNSKIIEINNRYNEKDCGLGRIESLDTETTLVELVDKIKRIFNVQQIRVVKGKDTVKKIAVINGSGQGMISAAVNLGADTIITGDTTYHFASDFQEQKVNIIDLGHFTSEWIVFIEVIRNITSKIDGVEFVISDKVQDPYMYM